MRDIGVGVIGTGFMGKAHCFAYRAVAGIFPGSLRPVLQSVADIDGRAAEQAAQQFGFLGWRTDWRTLVTVDFSRDCSCFVILEGTFSPACQR